MAQFTQYSWSDASAPQLTGAAGSLIAVLDACLVTGYGAKAAAGWSHPVATAGNCASYQQGAASQADFSFQLNDNGPNVTSTYKEAWATGWKTCTAVTAPVGTGTGQFPTAAQLLTTGHVVIRKSATADAVTRPWTIFADARTVYLFVLSGDGSTYLDFAFGEFYSYATPDAANCLIMGRRYENTAATSISGGSDRISLPSVGSGSSAYGGHYFADNSAGSAGSQVLFLSGDLTFAPTPPGANSASEAAGRIPSPNPADNSLYLAPLLLLDSTWNIRGHLRGRVHVCHPLSAIPDGSPIVGSGDFASRSYLVFQPGTTAGFLAVETSNTVDTN